MFQLLIIHNDFLDNLLIFADKEIKSTSARLSVILLTEYHAEDPSYTGEIALSVKSCFEGLKREGFDFSKDMSLDLNRTKRRLRS